MERMVSYRFGRLNLTQLQEEKKAFLVRTLTSTVELETHTNIFGFFDVTELAFENRDFIVGKLVKLKHEVKTKVGDLATHKLEDVLIKDNMIAAAPFILHVGSGIIAFRLAQPHINNSNFRRYFSQLVEKAHDYFFVEAEIQSITEDYELLEVIKTYPAILLVDVTVHPTNPSAAPVYQEVDDRLNDLEAESIRERIKAKNKTRGLKVKNDEKVIAKITMAEDGYGSARVDAIREDGKQVTIRTKDKTVVAKAPADEEDPNGVLQSLIGTFLRLWERGKK